MWTLLSFTGRSDVDFLKKVIEKAGDKVPTPMPGERTEEQKQKVHAAVCARGRLRRGAMLARLQESGVRLRASQLLALQQYESGELRQRANDLTLISGHVRLKREDNTFVDIGGSTGGYVRVVMDDWEPPDIEEFE